MATEHQRRATSETPFNGRVILVRTKHLPGCVSQEKFPAVNSPMFKVSEGIKSRRNEVGTAIGSKTTSPDHTAAEAIDNNAIRETQTHTSHTPVPSRSEKLPYAESELETQAVIPVRGAAATVRTSDIVPERCAAMPVSAMPRLVLRHVASGRVQKSGVGTVHSAPRVRNVAASAIVWRATPGSAVSAQQSRDVMPNTVRRKVTLQKAYAAPRARNVAESAIKWRATPTVESAYKIPRLRSPILSASKPPPAKTYVTDHRYMLAKLFRHAGETHRGPGQGVTTENKPLLNGYNLAPTARNFEYPEDCSPSPASQDSLTLEQHACRGREASLEKDDDEAAESIRELDAQRHVRGDQMEELGEEEESESEVDEQEEEQHPVQDQEEEDRQEEEEAQGRLEEPDEEQPEEQDHIVENESLDQIERELLGIDDGCVKGQLDTSTSTSPKRSRTAEIFKSSKADKQNDEEGNESCTSPTKKRRTEPRVPSVEIRKTALRELNDRRASKTARKAKVAQLKAAEKPAKPSESKKTKHKKSVKKPRRLPDNGELLLVQERLDESDIEGADTPPLELSQDPISQIEDKEENGVNSRHRGRKNSAKIQKLKAFGTIDISLFRMPQRSHFENYTETIKSYSDGFSAQERTPIGLLMPIKLPIRRKQSCHTINVKYRELSLVSEKPLGHMVEEIHRQKKSRKSKKRITRSAAPELNDDRMHMDEEERPRSVPVVQNLDLEKLSVNPPTPNIPHQSLLSSTPAGNSSPLKGKSQKVRHTLRDIRQSEQKAHSQPIPVVQEQIADLLEPPDSITIQKKTMLQRRDEQIASQEISRVTMKRPMRHKDERDEGQIVYRNTGDAVDHGADNEGEGETEEDAPYLTPSENKEEDDREEHIPDDDGEAEYPFILNEGGVQKGIEKGEENDGHENIKDVIPAEAHDEKPLKQSQHIVQARSNKLALILPRREEYASLLLELHQKTEFEKARLAEKRQTPRSSQPERAKYISKVQDQETASSQRLSEPKITVDTSKLENRVSQRSLPPTYNLDSSWRPRIPDTRGPDMQVDEEITDVTTPPRERARAALSRFASLRRRPSIRSQSLYVVDELPESGSLRNPFATTCNSQEGSIILGDTQKFHHSYPADVPETQVELVEEENVVVMVPEQGYFSQASQHLSQPFHVSRSGVNRTLSVPARARLEPDQEEDESGHRLMAGGISMSAAFQHTVSPATSSSAQQLSWVQPLNQPRTPSQRQNKSLRELTRSASMGMGTLHASAKRRPTSAIYQPPFKKPLQT
ncbi:uncharacterized protein RSE6_02143 [Rhynchosporium secalis]|uniref:Uncharacterized protein n=1 Tax=Rhynchosporium secalis TaxID=38038 RepID=A0A1E1LZJ1_RHYSE|nr:uncharacterized protein RSE6_02143 [Rhynchosporium secalis]